MGQKILIVDDNPDIVEVISSRLEANDYEVISALTGAEALKKAKAERPDLIILDINMAEMDGFEIGTLLRKDTATRKIPIIMATARGDQADIVEALQKVGPQAYVIKPFMPEALLSEIKRVLGKSV